MHARHRAGAGGRDARVRAFTLIELLIVVAIIAILAAIAVPNFLEAQVRSKVSRVKNDMRAYATALEAYAVDHNTYPEDQDNNPLHPTERGFYRLTTPIAYITTLFRDPFSDATHSDDTNKSSVAAFYVMASGANNNPLLYVREQCYTLISIGPDKADSSSGQDRFPSATQYFSYDPTNGSVSDGDIYRFGGNYRTGNWRLNGVPWQSWGNVPMLLPE
jgi:prepilin-type N-terminal cleavage/methylation domain-containing protein